MGTAIGILGAINIVCLSYAYERDPAGNSVQIVCPCQYKYDPVCGSDGITYMNKCVLDCTSRANEGHSLPAVIVVDERECSGNCNCQHVDLPVCTLDGQTYPNECELSCENFERIANKRPIIDLAYRTACRGAPGHCTNITVPVCGTDNVLYRNKCVLDYVNTYNSELGLPPLTVKNNGACQEGFLCPLTRQPVCASDGHVYYNPCQLEAENERRRCREVTNIIYEADQSVCSGCHCPNDGEPICASDGNTYLNFCQLQCAIRKEENHYLRSVHKGECRECKCVVEHDPVCGTDRKTYDSHCFLECENVYRSKESPPITVFHSGKCHQFECDCSYCDETYEPVCGSDEQTYWNLCWLQCNDSCYQKNGKYGVSVSSKRPC